MMRIAFCVVIVQWLCYVVLFDARASDKCDCSRHSFFYNDQLIMTIHYHFKIVALYVLNGVIFSHSTFFSRK